MLSYVKVRPVVSCETCRPPAKENETKSAVLERTNETAQCEIRLIERTFLET